MTSANLYIPTKALIARNIEYWTDGDVISWAVEYAESFDIWDSDTFSDLLRINPNQIRDVEKAHSRLVQFVAKEYPDFSFKSKDSEHQAKLLLVDRLKAYIDERCRPYDLCKMAEAIENTFDYPDWLGDLWNACDWIEPNTLPCDCRHLQPFARELLEALTRE